jgi:hypothetical protein
VVMVGVMESVVGVGAELETTLKNESENETENWSFSQQRWHGSIFKK